MHRSYFLGLLIVTAVAAALAGALGGSNQDETYVLSVHLPELATSTVVDPAPTMELTTTPPTALSREPDADRSDLITTTTTLATTTVAPTTTTLATTTVAPTTTAAKQPAQTQPKKSAPPAPAAQGGFNPGFESDFASSINSFRSSNGLAGLARDGSLDTEARAWAKRMAERGDLSHSNIGRFIPPWSAAAENIGRGGSVSSLFDALTGSSGHRANMLGGYTHFGIGVWVDGSGTLWTAHVFTG